MRKPSKRFQRMRTPSWAPLMSVAALSIAAICTTAVWGTHQAFAQSDNGTSAVNTTDSADLAQLIKRGQYLATAGDCIACHTASGGAPFAGGLPMSTPIGTIYSTNITPDKTTGIGDYTLQDFDRALRRGIAKHGGTLYPAMPYPSYARLSNDDVTALYAYFEHGVAPVDQQNRASDIKWPLSMRWPLTIWRWAFAPAVSTAATSPLNTVPPADANNADSDAMMARGKYLIEGLGHCGACHTPRGVGMQEKALSEHDGPAFLSGAEVDHWFAPSLRGDAVTGLGSWSEQDIADFLKTGRSDKAAVFGGMTDVVINSTQHMTDQDRAAIAHYLKSLAPAQSETAIDPSAGGATTTALHNGQMDARGARIYADNCMACHKSNGQGYAQVFPALAGNPAVNTANAASLIHIVLAGSTLPATETAPTSFHMPAFAYRLSDQDVADVVTFIRGGWGNGAAAVDASQVEKLRDSLHLVKH